MLLLLLLLLLLPMLFVCVDELACRSEAQMRSVTKD
jgi:hypothetical protein